MGFINLTGGTLPPLHGAAIIDVGPRLIMWGGLDLTEYRCRDDLLVIEELPRPKRAASALFQVTYVETLGRKTPSRKGIDNPHQSGLVPSGMHHRNLHSGIIVITSPFCLETFQVVQGQGSRMAGKTSEKMNNYQQ